MMSILVVAIILMATPSLTFTYPIFGTKRYHRNMVAPLMTPMAPIYPPIVPQYATYDTPYLSSAGGYNSLQSDAYLPDDNVYYYYPRHDAPSPPYGSSYGMPTYRGEYKPKTYYYAPGPSLNFYDDDRGDLGGSAATNPLDYLHEEMLQEDELEKQRDLMPIVGQETWYESPSRQSASLANAKAAFLQNLILYNRQLGEAATQQEEPNTADTGDFEDYEIPAELYDPTADSEYNRAYAIAGDRQHYAHSEPDKDVRELKSLASKNNGVKASQQNTWPPHNSPVMINTNMQYDTDPDYGSWINWDRKRSAPSFDASILAFSDRKPASIVHVPEKNYGDRTSRPTKASLVESSRPLRSASSRHNGQKEVVLPRPSTPVKNPFILPLENNVTTTGTAIKSDQTSTPSSIYDTIKQLISMEQKLDKVPDASPRLQKRFVSSEESLVKQLDSLKRRSA